MQPRKSQCASNLRVNTLLILGLSLVALGGVISAIWPSYYKNMITNELKMTPTSKTFEVWLDNPVPIYIEFFFFNWTNSEKLKEEGDLHIPHFTELGPYRFIEKIERVNLTWNDNSTLTYEQAKWWYFDAENSKGSLDDEITTLNIVALTAAFTVRDWSFLLQKSTDTALGMTKQQIQVVRPVRQLLFEGYSDSLITMARSLNAFARVEVPFDKFGWFYKRNGSTFMDGVFNMNTGVENIQRMGKLEFWNYKNSTRFFSDECADVLGTTGQLFPPGQTRQNKVQMFSPDLCRSVAFEYEKDTRVHDVPGYKYVGGISMLDNGTVFPDNACYCNGECVPSGVVNVSSCRFGAPAFASFPHFYLADPFFTDNVRGIRPDKEKHQFYLTLEPTTGIPLDVAARFQINLLLQPLPGMRLFENVPTLFFPMLWFQQRATITASMASELKMLLWLQYFGVAMTVLTAFMGCLLIGYSILLFVRIKRKRTMQKEKDREEANMYIATMESPKKDKFSRHYIVMKPRKEVDSVNL